MFVECAVQRAHWMRLTPTRAMAAMLDHFSDRLQAGARSDLLDLAKITFVKSRTARVFYENGFKSIAAVANTDPKELVPVLMQVSPSVPAQASEEGVGGNRTRSAENNLQAQPMKLRLKANNEIKYEEKLLAKASVIVESASRLWRMQAIDALLVDAQALTKK